MVRINGSRAFSTLLPPRIAAERALRSGKVTKDMLPPEVKKFAPWIAKVYNEFAKCSGQFILYNPREYIFHFGKDGMPSPHPFIEHIAEQFFARGGTPKDFEFIVDRVQVLRSAQFEDLAKVGDFDERA